MISSYKAGHVVVRGFHFERGKVVIKRRDLVKSERKQNGRVLARARVSVKGKFTVMIRWPKRRLAFRVYQHGKSTFGLFEPVPRTHKHKPGHKR